MSQDQEKQARFACCLCTRRKVKCTKEQPSCSNCLKSNAACTYESAKVVSRPRKRRLDDELLEKIARYEDLMRKNNIDFVPYANTWLPPQGPCKFEEQKPPTFPNSSSISTILTPPSTSASTSTSPLPPPSLNSNNTEQCIWSSLPPSLQSPPFQTLRRKDETSSPFPTLSSVLSDAALHPELHLLHPPPLQIYRLWQIFLERVNPLVKIIHVPTLQPHILEASYDPSPSRCPPPLTAMLFSIYSLAIASLSPGECTSLFGDDNPPSVLLPRYQTACLRALIAANFLSLPVDHHPASAYNSFTAYNPRPRSPPSVSTSTSSTGNSNNKDTKNNQTGLADLPANLTTLQAMYHLLLSSPDSPTSHAMVGAAWRVAHRLRLHESDSDHYTQILSPLEREMRIRLWWQLGGLEARTKMAAGNERIRPAFLELRDMRLPRNLGDAELLQPLEPAAGAEFSGMEGVEEGGDSERVSEMICVLVKLGMCTWRRDSSISTRIMSGIGTIGRTDGDGNGDDEEEKSKDLWQKERAEMRNNRERQLAAADEAINELESLYENRYFQPTRGFDPQRNALHRIAKIIADMAVACLRFKIHHPRLLLLQQRQKEPQLRVHDKSSTAGNDYTTTTTTMMTSRRENDNLFHSAVKWVDLVREGTKNNPFSVPVFSHLTVKPHLDAYILMLAYLRQYGSYSSSSFSSKKAWLLIQDLYDSHPELLITTTTTEHDSGGVGGEASSFVSALGNLVLEAWGVKEKEEDEEKEAAAASTGGFFRKGEEDETTPGFIRGLRSGRREREEQQQQQQQIWNNWNINNNNNNNNNNVAAFEGAATGGGGLDLTIGANLAWENWEDFFTGQW